MAQSPNDISLLEIFEVLKTKRFVDMTGLYEDIRAPQLSNVDVASDLAQLRELLPEKNGRGRPHLIVGNSLGGFYAWHLCRQKTDALYLLINPASQQYRLTSAPTSATLSVEGGPAPFSCSDLTIGTKPTTSTTIG